MPISNIHKGVTFTNLLPNSHVNKSDLEDKKNSYLLFSRGFLLCKINDLQINSHFSKINITTDTYLYKHDLLNILCCENNSKKIYLLGFSYFCSEKYINSTLNDAEILMSEFIKSKNDFLKALNSLAGRYIIILIDNNDISFFNDACGLKQIFFSPKNKCIGSHLELVNLVSKSYPSKLDTYFNDQQFIFNYAYPANLTTYEDIFIMTPNHELFFNDFSQHRYFPVEPIVKCDNLLNIKNELFKAFQFSFQQIKKKNKNICISITGGRDSNVTFYAIKELIDDNIIFFTEDRDKDIEQVNDIAKKYKLNWIGSDSKDINLENNRFYKLYNEIVIKNIFPKASRFSLKNSFYNFNLFGINNNYIHLHSNCAEVARGGDQYDFFSSTYNFENFKKSYLKMCVSWKSNDLKDSIFNKMYADEKMNEILQNYYNFLNLDSLTKLNYNPWNFMYMEQHMANIISEIHIANDPFFESFSLSNCRDILNIMWKVPEEHINVESLLYNCILNENDERRKNLFLGENFIPSNNDFIDNNYQLVYGGNILAKKITESSTTIDFCKNVISINNTTQWAYVKLLEELIHQNKCEECFNYYKKLVTKQPQSVYHWIGVSVCEFLNKNNKNEYVDEILNLVSNISKNVDWWYRFNSKSKSIEFAKKAFELVPTNIWNAITYIKTLIVNKKHLDAYTIIKTQMQEFTCNDWFMITLKELESILTKK